MPDESDDKKPVERALEERATDEKRQWSGSTPTEDVMDRALEKGDERPDAEELTWTRTRSTRA